MHWPNGWTVQEQGQRDGRRPARHEAARRRSACRIPPAGAAETLQLSTSLGVLIGVDLGATSVQLAVLKPDLTVLARHAEAVDVRRGPGVVLARMRMLMRELLSSLRADGAAGHRHRHGCARPGGLRAAASW